MKIKEFEIIIFFLILCAGLFEFVRYRKDDKVFDIKETAVTVLILAINTFIIQNFKQISSYIDPSIYSFISKLDDYSIMYGEYFNRIGSFLKLEKGGVTYYIL